MTINNATQNKLWLTLRFVALPALLLLPFWLVTYTTASCFKVIEFDPGHHLVTGGGMRETANPWYFGALFWILIIVFLAASFLQIGTRKYRLRYIRAKQQLVVASISAILSGIMYAVLYQVSQWKYPPNWSCDSHYVLHGGLSDKAHVGLGLAPIVVITLITLYILAPATALLVTRPKSRKLWITD